MDASLNGKVWQTKPSDRFVLRWIKVNLSSRITPRLLHWNWLEPWMITLFSAGLAVAAGLIFASGYGWAAGTLAVCAQILDGVDGQYARVTGRQSKGGAFWDSVLDRYADGAMMVGLIVYLMRFADLLPPWLILLMAYLALTGSNLISYSSARAESLKIDLGMPTLASKGSRSTVMILAAWSSSFWPQLPLPALIYLAVHPNLVVAGRLWRTVRLSDPL
jgi:phosphatidylglycerophosphate synthase